MKKKSFQSRTEVNAKRLAAAQAEADAIAAATPAVEEEVAEVEAEEAPAAEENNKELKHNFRRRQCRRLFLFR
jgi:small subunit ribosomal protein S16